MISKLSIKKEDLFCKEGNKITKVCTNPECTISLACEIDECKSCGEEVHDYCPSIPFKKISSLLS